jgi:hypothetical protein
MAKQSTLVPCPRCGSSARRQIRYGYVARPLTEEEERRFVLGGCVIPLEHPTHECNDCGTRYVTRRDLPEIDERLTGDRAPDEEVRDR